jgi:hypothetical protein
MAARTDSRSGVTMRPFNQMVGVPRAPVRAASATPCPRATATVAPSSSEDLTELMAGSTARFAER